MRAGPHLDGVLSVKSCRLNTNNPEAVASLLAIRFQPNGAEDPGGMIEFVFSGGGTLRLEVECIAAELSDISGEWAAQARPVHEAEARHAQGGTRRRGAAELFHLKAHKEH